VGMGIRKAIDGINENARVA